MSVPIVGNETSDHLLLLCHFPTPVIIFVALLVTLLGQAQLTNFYSLSSKLTAIVFGTKERIDFMMGIVNYRRYLIFGVKIGILIMLSSNTIPTKKGSS